MSEGQMSTQWPQPSQRVIYTKVGMSVLEWVVELWADFDSQAGQVQNGASVLARQLAFDADAKLRRLVCRFRQIVPGAVGFRDALLIGSRWLEKHVGEF